MNIIRDIRTPIMHRMVEANGFVFVGGTIAELLGHQDRTDRCDTEARLGGHGTRPRHPRDARPSLTRGRDSQPTDGAHRRR
jgi:hypothetical protein